MDTYLLSIIIPIFNAEIFLEECIESIIQDNENYEILLIDDGSTDNSSRICDNYSTKYKFIRSIHTENGGVSSARNLGLSLAKGKYIMFVDADDILDNSWSSFCKYLKDDDIYYLSNKLQKKIKKEEMLSYIIGNNKNKIYLSGPYCKAFKLDFIKRNNIQFKPDIINGEDMLFNTEALLSSQHYSILNNTFYNYRLSSIQSTKQFNEKIIDSDKKFHKYLKQILKKNKINNNTMKETMNFCKQGAILTILNRISYTKNYKLAKKYFWFLKDEPYVSALGKKNDNIIIHMCNKKWYYGVYLTLKIKNKIRNFKLKNNRDSFKKI